MGVPWNSLVRFIISCGSCDFEGILSFIPSAICSGTFVLSWKEPFRRHFDLRQMNVRYCQPRGLMS